MWVSIAAWAVTVLNLVVSLEAGRRPSGLQRLTELGASHGAVELVSSSCRGPDILIDITGPYVSARLDSPRLDRRLLRPYVLRNIDADGEVLVVLVPTWYFAVPPTLAFFILHRRDRRLAHRLKHNLCTRCGYSRAGIAEGAKCPECGAGPANTRT